MKDGYLVGITSKNGITGIWSECSGYRSWSIEPPCYMVHDTVEEAEATAQRLADPDRMPFVLHTSEAPDQPDPIPVPGGAKGYFSHLLGGLLKSQAKQIS